MANTSYEERAIKFANILAKMFKDCHELDDFVKVINIYNFTHVRKLKWDNGVSRIAIIRSDYVIKFDYTRTDSWKDGRAGNCASELEVYAKAVEDGMAHLLAKTTVLNINGLTVSIMPKINHVNDQNRNWWKHCTREEEKWLDENVNDLHDGNIGYLNNKVCVIDYAWAVRHTDDSESES